MRSVVRTVVVGTFRFASPFDCLRFHSFVFTLPLSYLYKCDLEIPPGSKLEKDCLPK